MTTALELSVKFGLTVTKIEEICAYLDVYLSDSDIARDPEFERIARSIKRNRASAYTHAWIFRSATADQAEFLLSLSDELREEYESLGEISDSEIYPFAKVSVDRLADERAGAEDWIKLADWIKETVLRSAQPVRHSYLAVRLLLGIPETAMPGYSKPVAQILNKARHRGLLEGWHVTVPENGKNVVLYGKGVAVKIAGAIVNPGVSDADIANAKRALKTDDNVKLAGYISFYNKIPMKDVLAYLEKLPLDL